MQKFCPNCGAPITNGTYCDACVEEEPYDEVRIKLCPSRQYQRGGTWTAYEHPDEIVEGIKADVAPSTRIERVSHNYDRLRHRIGESFDTAIFVMDEGVEHRVPVHVSVEESPARKRQKPSSKEATVQLRDVSEGDKEHVHEALRDLAGDASLIAIQDVPNGVDLVWGEKNEARRFAQSMREERGGVFKASRTLHTVDSMSSKRVYRSTYMVRFLGLEPGDVVVVDSTPHFVERVGERVHLRDLRGGDVVSREPDSLINADVLEKHKVTVSQVEPEIMVLHPETYQAVTTHNPFDYDVTSGQTVTVVSHGGAAFICND